MKKVDMLWALIAELRAEVKDLRERVTRYEEDHWELYSDMTKVKHKLEEHKCVEP